MLLLSLTFSSSSELTLCSPHDDIFTFISLLYMFSETKLYSFSYNSSYNISSFRCIFLLGPAIMFTHKTWTQDICQAIIISYHTLK
jgi:hypothetical protein